MQSAPDLKESSGTATVGELASPALPEEEERPDADCIPGEYDEVASDEKSASFEAFLDVARNAGTNRREG